MLPTELWYYDPNKPEKLTEYDHFIQKEDKMGWERVLLTIAVMVAEETLRQYFGDGKD